MSRNFERIGGIPRRDFFCLTRENLSSPWLLFEARAISKHREAGHVCTYLIGLTSNDVEEPLSQFQHTRADKEDTLQLLQTINSLLDITLEVARLNRPSIKSVQSWNKSSKIYHPPNLTKLLSGRQPRFFRKYWSWPECIQESFNKLEGK